MVAFPSGQPPHASVRSYTQIWALSMTSEKWVAVSNEFAAQEIKPAAENLLSSPRVHGTPQLSACRSRPEGLFQLCPTQWKTKIQPHSHLSVPCHWFVLHGSSGPFPRSPGVLPMIKRSLRAFWGRDEGAEQWRRG